MRLPEDRPLGPGPHDGLNPCEFHSSDGWVFLDGVITIFSGVATILLVTLRHPFKFLLFVILFAVIGTMTGWWTP